MTSGGLLQTVDLDDKTTDGENNCSNKNYLPPLPHLPIRTSSGMGNHLLNNPSLTSSSVPHYRTADSDPTGFGFIFRNCCALMLRLQFCLRITCMVCTFLTCFFC